MYFLRSVLGRDYSSLALSLRVLDREELAASHPGKEPEKLLRIFVKKSYIARSFIYANQVVAMGGIAKEKNNSYVWLLTGKEVEKCPKAFFKTVRLFLQNALLQTPVLCNWVDERYVQARRFILHLGGNFSGEYIVCGKTKFLFFTFRRQTMGGIVQAGKTYVSTASQAFDKRKKQHLYYTEKLRQTEEDKKHLLASAAQEQEYLFRSAAERQRSLYNQARAAADSLLVKRAKSGLTNSSATAKLMQDKAHLQADLQAAELEKQMAQTLHTQENQTRQSLEKLTRQAHAYRRAKNEKGTLWKLGKQLFSWFH